MSHARYSADRHLLNFRERFKTEWSNPHLDAMQALIRAGYRIVSEKPIQCEDCGQPNCHHEWKPDLRIVGMNIIVEIHRVRNKKDHDNQAARKRCLENSDWIVIVVTDKDPPGLAVERVERTLKLAEVIQE